MLIFWVSHDNASDVIAGFPTPPSKPGVPLSRHRALQGSTFLARHYHRVRVPFPFARYRGNFMSHRVSCYSGSPCPCRPSPCGRLSRPPTTMAAPTLLRFHRPIAGLRFTAASRVHADGLCKVV